MKKISLLAFFNAWITIVNSQSSTFIRTRPFDDNWRFINDSTISAEVPGFADQQWRTVDLPHDWSIEDLPKQIADSVVGPFAKYSTGQYATGWSVGGTGWYRKRFVSEKSFQNQIVSIHFDGVYMNSDVWLNGNHLGTHPYGYTPFHYDMTPYLKPSGQENILVVKVRNDGKNSRWYSGSGIYRHVWLNVTGHVHLENGGVYITTPNISAKSASVQLQTTIENDRAATQDIILVTTIISPAGQQVKRSQKVIKLNANKITDLQSFSVADPVLWSIEWPQLYKAITEIKKDNKIIDRVETIFGIRDVSISAVNGFFLNGRRVLLKGGCIHHDNGPLGAATIDRAEERKIEILKKNGYNAIRTSHNPPSKQLLDACDRMGMLVIDEAFDMWERPKNPQDYHLYFKDWWQADIDAMVLRDRNHPSVVFWSIGNEINERVDSSGLRITKELKERVRQLDPSRAVTEALCFFWDHAGYKWDTTANAYALLDVGGYNYQMSQYESDHQKYPDRVMMGTESFPGQALENWNMVEKHPYLLGDFVWTAYDYMGEAAIGHSTFDSKKMNLFVIGWPWFNANCGDIDLIGNKKPQSYYRDVVWRNRPIAMAVHTPIPKGMVENVSLWGWPNEQQSWTWPGQEDSSMQVRVFSRAPVVRLLLNGKIIGEQEIADNSITAVFNVPYKAGTLKAVNVIDGREKDAIEFRTSGKPAAIRLRADRTKMKADKNDLSYVMVEIVDNKGQVVPDAELPVSFSISGAGMIAGVGNGNPTDMASFQKPNRKTWRGKCLVIVRPNGKNGAITLTTAADKLTSAKLIITAN